MNRVLPALVLSMLFALPAQAGPTVKRLEWQTFTTVLDSNPVMAGMTWGIADVHRQGPRCPAGQRFLVTDVHVAPIGWGLSGCRGAGCFRLPDPELAEVLRMWHVKLWIAGTPLDLGAGHGFQPFQASYPGGLSGSAAAVDAMQAEVLTYHRQQAWFSIWRFRVTVTGACGLPSTP